MDSIYGAKYAIVQMSIKVNCAVDRQQRSYPVVDADINPRFILFRYKRSPTWERKKFLHKEIKSPGSDASFKLQILIGRRESPTFSCRDGDVCSSLLKINMKVFVFYWFSSMKIRSNGSEVQLNVWTLTRPWLISFSAIFMQICWCANQCLLTWPDLSQALAAGQMASHLPPDHWYRIYAAIDLRCRGTPTWSAERYLHSFLPPTQIIVN